MKVIALVVALILVSSFTTVYGLTSNEKLLLKYKDPRSSNYYIKVSGGKYEIDVYTFGENGDYEKTIKGNGPKKIKIKCDYQYDIWVNDAEKGTLIELYKDGQRIDGLRFGNTINSLDGKC